MHPLHKPLLRHRCMSYARNDNNCKLDELLMKHQSGPEKQISTSVTPILVASHDPAESHSQALFGSLFRSYTKNEIAGPVV